MLPSNFRLKNGAKYIFHVKNTKYIAMKYYNLHERIHILTEYRPFLDLFDPDPGRIGCCPSYSDTSSFEEGSNHTYIVPRAAN